MNSSRRKLEGRVSGAEEALSLEDRRLKNLNSPYKVMVMIRESHSQPIQASSLVQAPFLLLGGRSTIEPLQAMACSQVDPCGDNLFATVGHDQLTIYDDMYQVMGGSLTPCGAPHGGVQTCGREKTSRRETT